VNLLQREIKVSDRLEFKRFLSLLASELDQRFVDLKGSQDDIIADFVLFEQLLNKWQRVQNLVSRETLDQFWLRHVLDSLQLLGHFENNTKLVLDFGSGGGFPAVVLAIALKRDDVKFVLVESNARKVAFLRAVKRELGLNLVVMDVRIEDFELVDDIKPDIITARALANLSDLLEFSYPFWQEKTKALFLKGKEYSEELEKARVVWRFNVLIHKNIVDDLGVVLDISNLKQI